MHAIISNAAILFLPTRSFFRLIIGGRCGEGSIKLTQHFLSYWSPSSNNGEHNSYLFSPVRPSMQVRRLSSRQSSSRSTQDSNPSMWLI